MEDVNGDESRSSRLVLDALVEDAQGDAALYEETQTRLSGPDEIARSPAPIIEQIPSDNPADAPRCVLDRGDAKLRVGVGDSGVCEDLGVIVREDRSAIPRWYQLPAH